MLNHAARTEWKNGTREVSSFLDAAVSSVQACLLNPTTLDTITGYIMEDTKGEGARRRLPARRLNMIDACISSWCSVLNSKDKLVLIKQANELAKVLGEIEKDREDEKQKRLSNTEQEEKEKQARAEKRLEKEINDREEGLLQLPPLIQRLKDKGCAEFPNFTVPQLCIIICYEFTDEEGKSSKLNKAPLIELAMKHYDGWIENEMQTMANIEDMGAVAIPNMAQDDNSTIMTTNPV